VLSATLIMDQRDSYLPAPRRDTRLVIKSRLPEQLWPVEAGPFNQGRSFPIGRIGQYSAGVGDCSATSKLPRQHLTCSQQHAAVFGESKRDREDNDVRLSSSRCRTTLSVQHYSESTYQQSKSAFALTCIVIKQERTRSELAKYGSSGELHGVKLGSIYSEHV